LKFGHNFSIDLRFHTHYEGNVLTAATKYQQSIYLTCCVSWSPNQQIRRTSLANVT